MNGNHVRPKLKIRNRVLAIIVAFLLLSLMIPHAVFATESTDATIVDPAKEVNNAEDNAAADVPATDIVVPDAEPVAEPVSNVNITGKVTALGVGLGGVEVKAYTNDSEIGSATTLDEGGFTINTSAELGTNVLLTFKHNNYASDAMATTIDGTVKSIDLKSKIEPTVKPTDEETSHHEKFIVSTTVGNMSISEDVGSSPFVYPFPVGTQFQMTSQAHMLFHYTNSNGQLVNIKVTPKGAGYYRPYYWGFVVGAGPGQLMKIGQDYTLESGNTYTIGLVYLNQTKLKVSSQDANHDAFHFVFKKNGIQMHELTQASFDTTMYVGAACTVQQDGTIKIFFDDSDTENQFVIEATVTPIAKAGYKIAGWTYNGKELKVGDTVTSTDDVPMAFEAKYEVDASTAPATGDMDFVWIIALSGIALGAAAGALRFRKNH